jgi:hypothetical protein
MTIAVAGETAIEQPRSVLIFCEAIRGSEDDAR